MANKNPVETYFKELREIRSTGGGTDETSYYGALENLLNAMGKKLKPKVRAVSQLANVGAGHPDFGLYAQSQFQRVRDDKPIEGQLPERGVIEAKPTADDSWLTAEGGQVSKYWDKYHLVLVTNYRDFVLVGQDAEGKSVKLETFRLADSEKEFWAATVKPRKFAEEIGQRFADYLDRVMRHSAPLATPKDLAALLASYAREARFRVEDAGTDALAPIKDALEQSLGLEFSEDRGEHFFRSTLVQTLFYGVFSAWVIWAHDHPPSDREAHFRWKEAMWTLHVPMIQALFEKVATPSKMKPLGLVELLDWTEAALNRVDRANFFSVFDQGQAVQYFYEPFLEAFDPTLRKDLGVWYTPSEIVQYMVARVDQVLKSELGIADGLADPQVYVLDPCCGTGAYLVEVLNTIAETLREKGGDGLLAHDLKKAATERVFGFEILTAPFVVAHMQIGLLLQQAGAPLATGKSERAGVYLTNALTGWEPPKEPKNRLPFPEFEQEREAADKVKQKAPILVILGNPPYNGYAGMAVEEERALTDAYRETIRAPRPQGQGLNDLFVRFFRMAEHRIVGMSGKGIVCYISNYSWLDGLSFTGMRERYLEDFDRIWIDCLNGDKYKTGKLTPTGEPDPSVFSTKASREGIQVGTAISLLVRQQEHQPADHVQFRHLWGKEKRAELLASAPQPPAEAYDETRPSLEMGLPFLPGKVAEGYMNWPALSDLFPVSFPGVKTSRDEFLVDISRDKLEARLKMYFDPTVGDEAIVQSFPRVMEPVARYDPSAVRKHLLAKGWGHGSVVRYSYRPFDLRWLYYEPETNLLDRNRAEFFPQVFEGNYWIISQQKPRREWSRPQICSFLGCLDLMDRGASCIPLKVTNAGETSDLYADQSEGEIKPNLSDEAAAYLTKFVAGSDDLFFHTLAVLHAPAFADENAGALRQDWPRVPLPDNKQALKASAELGQRLAGLLNPETAVNGVTTGRISALLKTLGLITKHGGGQLDESAGDLAMTAGWGFLNKKRANMAGKGDARERDYQPDELEAIAATAETMGLSQNQALDLLGRTTYDIHLNDIACWKNVPSGVWNYYIGGYQVIKKWLSYREKRVLGRDLKPEEARYISEVVRRLASIILMGPQLDENYQAVKANSFDWSSLTNK